MDNSMPNKDIIDATQDAVLNAASTVVEVLETTANELNVHSESFYLTAEFWVAVAFILAVMAIAKPVGLALKK